MVPDNLIYTEEHEWIKVEGDTATIGITEHATEELGEIVFAELPEVGQSLNAQDEFGSVESVKTVSSLYAPISGTVTEVNQDIVDSPSVINDSPYDKGWIIKLSVDDAPTGDHLLSAEDYTATIG